MAYTAFRKITLVSITAIEQAEDEFSMWAAEYIGEQAYYNAIEPVGPGVYDQIRLDEADEADLAEFRARNVERGTAYGSWY